jgi:asparagine synthase (glutamine-hydrolysing)
MDLTDQPHCSDADLVLYVYERGGEAVLSRLRGSFVAVIIDHRRNAAIVARDPLGSHPLFYVETGSCVLFADTLQRLLDYPGVSRALNRAALADHLCIRWPDRQETFFAAVRRVPPGWKAVISGGRLSLGRCWDPMPAERPVQLLEEEETDRFEEVFKRAVDRCLHDGPTGVFLSGGLDSISVAATATDRAGQIGGNAPLALSLGFPYPECDEEERQKAVARHLGLCQCFMRFHEALGHRPLLEQVFELNTKFAAPIQNDWLPAYLTLARRARDDGVRIILTGQGGDEWLGASQFLAADLIRSGEFIELAKFVGALQRSFQLSLLPVVRFTLWTSGLRPLLALALHRLMPEAHQASRRERLLAGDPSWVAPDHTLRAEQRHRAGGALPDPDPPHGFYMREQRNSLGVDSWAAEEEYEWSKWIGVRLLHPFFDADVVETLYRTPPRVLYDGGRTKDLVRRTLAQRFPALNLGSQRKVNFTPLFKSIILREAPILADAAGDFPALSDLGIVDGHATQRYVAEGLKQGSGLQVDRIFQILNLESWVRSRLS